MLRRRRRTFLVAVTLAVASAAWAFRSARALVEVRTLEESATLLDLPSAWLHGETRVLSLNGARVELRSGRSDLTLAALLDHLESRCRAHAAGLAVGPVLRAAHGTEGVVACLDLGSEPLGLGELTEKLARFGAEADLAALGGVQLVRARALDHGTFFVAASTHGPVPLARMFPARGDAPGTDPRGLPRPEHARRLLAAYQEGRGPSITVYETEQPFPIARDGYRAALALRGFRSAHPDSRQTRPGEAQLFLRGGESAAVVLAPLGTGTRIVLLSLGP